MLSETQAAEKQYEQSLQDLFESIGKASGVQKMRTMFLRAKASLLGESSLTKGMRLRQLVTHRTVEKRLFGRITSLPGEEETLTQLTSSLPSWAEQEGLPSQNDELLHFLLTQKDSLGDAAQRALAAELRKRRLNFVAPTVAEAILGAAIASAQKIEREFWAKHSKPGKFNDEHFQDIVAEFVYVFFHLSDRDAYVAIPDHQKRSAFLDSVSYYILQFGKTSCMTDDHPVPAFSERKEWTDPRLVVVRSGMADLNERQKQYGPLPLFAAPGAPLAGTVFWEFGRHIAQICSHYEHRPSIQSEADLIACEAYKDIIPILMKMHEPPQKPVGFLGRLFRRRA